MDDDQYLLKSYAYTSTGNVESETLSGTDIDTLTTTYTYGYADKFRISAEKTVDGATFNETFAYDPRFGEVTTYTDPNGHETYINYNALGQKEIQTNPDGSKVEWYYAWGGATNALYAITTIDDTKPYITRYYDLLDREVLLKTHDLDGNIILQKKQYNAKGLLSQSSLPYISGDTEPTVAYSYDNYGRLTKLTKPSPSGDGQSVETTSYSAFQLVQTDGEGYKKKTVKNALGQTIKVVEGLGSSDESALSYRYDGLGNLIEAIDSASNTITYRYDNMGRKIYESDPDRGIHTYKYDVLGNMIYEADARGTEKTYSYDALSRLKSVDAQNSADSISKVITHTYDDKTNGIGELSTIHTQSLIDSEQSETQSEYYYDELSRLSKKSSIIDEEAHSIEYRYDNASRVKGVYVHDALGVDFNTYYVYKNGFLFGIKNPENKTADTSTLGYVYYTDQRDAWGNVVDEIFGNGVSTQKTYNNAGYLNKIYVRHALGYAGLHAINYNYDNVGNVIERKNTFSQEHYYMDETFTYDALRRINSMNVVVKPIPTVHLTGNTSLSAQSISMNSESEKIYRYDAIGNILQKGSINDYSYSSTKPHAVESANGKSYTYDANGNMLSRGDETIAYTAFDKPYALTNANGETTKFYYDGNNNRYKKKTSSYETLYLDKIYERKLYSGGGTDEYTGYFYFGDKLVAMQILQGESKTKSYRYVHTDSLDSISLITDENGDIVEQRSYEPFGEIRSMDYGNGIVPANTTNITNRSFTNHEQIGEMEGLIHMDGRVYDATIGRFLSADIHVPHPYSTQSYNRYSYVRNNPLGFTDPSGYTDLENTPGNSAIPNQGDTVPDTTPNGSVSFTEAGMYIKGPLEKIYFPNSPVANIIIANPINFVNSYTNTALNGLNAIGTLLEPYDGAGYSMMMGGNPAQRYSGAGIYTTAKFGRVLRYVGTMGQSERKLFDQLANQLSNMRPAHLGPFGENSITTLYRAVNPKELKNIENTKKFINKGSAEGKYFTTSNKNASNYAKQAVNAFGDEPYTIVKTKIKTNNLPEAVRVDDGGIPAYVIPNKQLNSLKPKILDTMEISKGR
ncbi:MAG: RHS repeat-associated core domain-containing protein [Sulfurovaceae bacterium]